MKQYNTIEIKTFYILYFNKAEMPRHVLFEEISEEHDQFSIICQSQSATDDYTLKDHVLSSKEKVICCSFLFFKMYIFSNYFHSTTFPRSTCTETFFILIIYYYSIIIVGENKYRICETYGACQIFFLLVTVVFLIAIFLLLIWSHCIKRKY